MNLKTTIEYYLDKKADEKNNDSKKWSIYWNDRPCSKCGGTDYIQLFRNVVGEISGSIYGSFSLFGGSVSGRIDGYTKTLPVLSCTSCKNEKEISTFKYVTPRKLFWSDMSCFYFGINADKAERFKEIEKIYLENPLETRKYAQDNREFDYEFYNEIVDWDTETWALAGFKIKKLVKENRFLFWKWTSEYYPSWEKLEAMKEKI